MSKAEGVDDGGNAETEPVKVLGFRVLVQSFGFRVQERGAKAGGSDLGKRRASSQHASSMQRFLALAIASGTSISCPPCRHSQDHVAWSRSVTAQCAREDGEGSRTAAITTTREQNSNNNNNSFAAAREKCIRRHPARSHRPENRTQHKGESADGGRGQRMLVEDFGLFRVSNLDVEVDDLLARLYQTQGSLGP